MEQQNSTQTVEVEKEVKGKLVLSFDKPTPTWATWVFRLVFLSTLLAAGIIAFEPGISAINKVRYLFYMKLFDGFIWGMARGLGIDKSKFADEQAGNFLNTQS